MKRFICCRIRRHANDLVSNIRSDTSICVEFSYNLLCQKPYKKWNIREI